MVEERFSRTALIIGEDRLSKLKNARVAIFGVGGVGGFAAEAIARSGVGHIDLFDKDEVSVSNLNRQIIALSSTVGKPKVEVMKERILDINPEAEVTVHNVFYLPENADEYDLSKYDYIVDAVDTVTAKLEIIVRAEKAEVPVISSMGAGNKLHPEMFKVSDIYKTSVCPLARVMRNELKKRGIKKLKVVYSEEKAIEPDKAVMEGIIASDPEAKKLPPGSISFVPSAAGLILAGEVIRDLCGI